MENDSYPAGQALEDIAAGNEALADRLTSPRWYHPVLGLGIAGFVLGVGLLPTGWNILPSLLLAVLCGWLVKTYSELSGLWARPTWGRPSGRLWIAYMVIVLACVAPALLSMTRLADPPLWLLIGAAVLTAVATMIIGPRIDAAMRAELRAGTARTRSPR